MALCSFSMKGQGRNNKYSYSNLKGVTRIGVFVPYQLEWNESIGIDYTKLRANKSTTSYAFYYASLNREFEEVTKVNLSMNFGKHFMNIGKWNYVRGIFGFEGGYEWKESKVITDKKSFLYGGISVGLENELFLSRHIIIPIGIKQSGHFYLGNVRSFTNAYVGLRLTFK